jgi:hypothetical protein
VKEIVQAIDPITLPFFLEFGSVLFFASAFPNHRKATVHQLPTLAPESLTVARKVFTRDDALRDFRTLKASNSQQFLAERWGVHEGTASKWLGSWAESGAIERHRVGKANRVAAIPQRRALPAPR